MQMLKNKIVNEGQIVTGDILKVDGFLNQMLDMELYSAMGNEIAVHFADANVSKILTVEASGIALSCVTAQSMGNVPVIFAKKHISLNRDAEFYSTPIFSFIHQSEYNVTIAKRFLSKDDRVLIVDDFLATGEAFRGLLNLVHQAGATVVGFASAIEKGYQHGGDSLRNDGHDVFSLAIIDSMDNCTIKFRP